MTGPCSPIRPAIHPRHLGLAHHLSIIFLCHHTQPLTMIQLCLHHSFLDCLSSFCLLFLTLELLLSSLDSRRINQTLKWTF
uniref:Uncharacterized protein n=1 Tax=Rhizophora mucronata TaxID=61149 RepID=A0A2P2PJ25_RHIMU